jgi:hypothetical protein
MRVLIDVESLRGAARLFGAFASGKGYFNERSAYGLFEAKQGEVVLTLATSAGGVRMALDAQVEEEGRLGVDLAAFAQFLKPFRGGWSVRLSTDFCEQTDERFVLVGDFSNGVTGAKHRQEWPINNKTRGGLLFEPEWVPDPRAQTGVLRQGRVSLERFTGLIASGLGGYREGKQELLNVVSLLLCRDQMEVCSTNGAALVQATAWAEEGVELGLEWEHEPEQLWLSGESLRRAMAFLKAIEGLEELIVSISTDEGQPIRLAAANDPEGLWVLVDRCAEGVSVPALLQEATAATSKVTARIPTFTTRKGQQLRGFAEELRVFDAYEAYELAGGARSGGSLLLEFGEAELRLEVLSELQIGATSPWEWASPPRGALEGQSGAPLVALDLRLVRDYLEAVLAPVERDKEAELELMYSISDEGLERLLLRTESDMGMRTTALICPRSHTGRRLADSIGSAAPAPAPQETELPADLKAELEALSA